MTLIDNEKKLDAEARLTKEIRRVQRTARAGLIISIVTLITLLEHLSRVPADEAGFLEKLLFTVVHFFVGG